MSKCLVTGATGCLGTNLVLELVDNGWDVRALGLAGSESKYIDVESVEIVFGDITKYEEVEKAADGMDVVFHVAGDTSFWKKNFKRQAQINIDGSVNVAKACVENGVKRMIHTATTDVIGFNPDGLADENWDNYNFGGIGFNYADTKREGEKRVREFSDKGLEVVVIYPGAMMGPYDFTLQYGRLFFDLRDGKVPAVPAGGTSLCNVRLVAKAHMTAAEKGRPGEGYICAGVNITYRQMFDAIATKFGRKAPGLTMPPALLTAYGWFEELIANFTNKPPQLNPGMARYMSVFPAYDSSKAVKELDYTMQPLEEIVDEAFKWYEDNVAAR